MAEKILIVDDDPNTVQFLTVMLNRLGYQGIAATDGLQALEMAHEHKPDLIVLDIMMPDIDGFEVARRLRRYPDTAMIPILMFTAKTQMQDKLAGYESGVDIYLTKPIHPVELHANIKALLVQKKARTQVMAEKGYVLGVLAAKGGVGASTMALNLAITYHQKHRVEVIAAELRSGQGSWGEELGFENLNGLSNLLRMNRVEIMPSTVEKQLVTTSYGIRLLLASESSADVDCATALPQFEAIVEQLAQLAELTVLDIGTNFHPAFIALTEMCNELLLVTEPQPLSVKRTRKLVEELGKRGFGSHKPLSVVSINRTRSDITLPVTQIEDMIKANVALGFPPATELAYHATMRGAPMCLMQPDGIIAMQFITLADQVAERAMR